ncbi:MAG TPA: ATP-binding protein [Pseudonocardia sp.]
MPDLLPAVCVSAPGRVRRDGTPILDHGWADDAAELVIERMGRDMEQTSNMGEAQRAEFAHKSWPAGPQHLPGMRGEVRRWLMPLSLSDEARYDLLVAVSEAVTNAIEHAYPLEAENKTVELSFWTEPRMVNLEIVDHGRWRTPAALPQGRGLGIPLMQRLVESVAIHFDSRGTRVLLTHPLPGKARERPPGCDQPTSLRAWGTTDPGK